MRDRHAHVQVPASQFFEAASESAPQLYLQLAYVTMEHWRVAAAQHVSWLPGVPIFLVSIAVSFVALVASSATYLGGHHGNLGPLVLGSRNGFEKASMKLATTRRDIVDMIPARPQL